MNMSIHHSASQMQHSDQIRRLIQVVKDLTKWTTRMPDLLEMSLRGQGVAASEANQMGMCISAYANEYVAAWTWWDAAPPPPGAAQLTLLLDAFAATTLPVLLNRLMVLMMGVVETNLEVHDHHQDAVIHLVLSCTYLLRIQDHTCPPLVKVCPALGQALHTYVRWLHYCKLTPAQADVALTMINTCLSECDPERILEIIPMSMVHDVLNTTADAYDRILYPRGPTPQHAAANLVIPLIVRNNLKVTQSTEMNAKAAMLSQDTCAVAHQMSKLAFVAIAGCDALVPEQYLNVLLRDVIITTVTWRPLTTRFRDASIIRSLHECALRYPACGEDCTKAIETLMPGRLMQLGRPMQDGSAALLSALNHCVQLALLWIKRTRTCRPTRTCKPTGIHLLTTYCTVLASISHLKGGDAGSRTLGIRTLFLSLTVPGTLIALEALLRDYFLRLPLAVPPALTMSFVCCAYTVTDALTLLPLQRHAYRGLLSLNSTLLKLVRYVLTQPHNDTTMWHLLGMLTCNTAMASRIGKGDKWSYRLYMLLCLSFPAVISKLRDVRVAVSPGTLSTSQALLDIFADTGPGYLQRYAMTGFGGELLCFCSNDMCGNLDGVSDATLPTQLCGGCKRARYCSIACQKAHWLEGGHAAHCVLGA